MDPAAAARIILKAVERRRRRVVVGRSAKVLDVVERLAPTAGGRLLTTAAKRIEQNARVVIPAATALPESAHHLAGVRVVRRPGRTFACASPDPRTANQS